MIWTSLVLCRETRPRRNYLRVYTSRGESLEVVSESSRISDIGKWPLLGREWYTSDRGRRTEESSARTEDRGQGTSSSVEPFGANHARPQLTDHALSNLLPKAPSRCHRQHHQPLSHSPVKSSQVNLRQVGASLLTNRRCHLQCQDPGARSLWKVPASLHTTPVQRPSNYFPKGTDRTDCQSAPSHRRLAGELRKRGYQYCSSTRIILGLGHTQEVL
jgi:hypothetical protein